MSTYYSDVRTHRTMDLIKSTIIDIHATAFFCTVSWLMQIDVISQLDFRLHKRINGSEQEQVSHLLRVLALHSSN